MATQAELEYLLGHALTADEKFRTRLCEDPSSTAKALGIILTSAQDAVLKGTSLKVLDEMAGLTPQLVPGPRPMWS